MRESNILDIPEDEESPLSFANAMQGRTIMGLVQEAVTSNHALLAFQPIVRSGPTHNIAFYEGLIRIQDPNGRIIPAKEFITQVEETETGRLIDCMALELGLKSLIQVPSLRLAINMSARSIGYGKWIDILGRALRRDPSLGQRLILEITESSAMMVPELVINFMRDLHKRGISFALDDFGSGSTSFRYLRDFDFDILKIDGQFIRSIETSVDDQVLVQALISIGQHFGMDTVAEAVETPTANQWLTKVGIDCQQGYYFAAPTVVPPWIKPAQKRRRA